MADKFAARSGEVKPLNEVDYEDIVNAAAIKMRKATSGVRGQIITVQDSLDWWVMKETERRILAALSSTQARADKLEEELASAQQSNENWMNRCLAAEASLAQANEALKAVNKLIEWERENGTHFVLIDREVEHVTGLWFDAAIAVTDYFKTEERSEG